MPKPNKRIVVFIESTPDGQTIQAFTSVKQLLAVHDVAPYDTIMNHLSRRGGAFVKGDVTIERVAVNPTIKPSTVVVNVRPACWGAFVKHVADRLSDDPPFDKSSPLYHEAEELSTRVARFEQSKKSEPIEVSRELMDHLIDEVENQHKITLDAVEDVDKDERAHVQRVAKILGELLEALRIA